jgi:hypothetical protein
MTITLNSTDGITTPAETVVGNESVGGNLTVTGNTNIGGTLAVTGNTTITGVLTASGGISGSITSGTPVASTSGTSIDFTSIPAGVKRITVILAGNSTNGNSGQLIQLGAGSVQTSGYTGSSMQDGAAFALLSSGFTIADNSAADVVSGSIVFVLLGSNQWIGTGMFGRENGSASGRYTMGRVTLGGVLDRVRITTVNGTDTFDAGSINILYE